MRVEVLVTGRDEPMHLPGVEGLGQQLLHRRNFGQSQQVNVEQKIWKKETTGQTALTGVTVVLLQFPKLTISK